HGFLSFKVTNEKMLDCGSHRSFDRRIGNDKTVTPVPPGTALHQLYSVPPTAREITSAGDSVSVDIDEKYAWNMELVMVFVKVYGVC
nr:hypothetical protein [Tanacetum cinerariifolium]